MTHYGHVDCGLYCEVLSGGKLAEGLQMDIEAKDQSALGFA
jgi:MOSC domain-containing protein YiiM